MINLIQLQTGADPGHRFYYHSAGIRSPLSAVSADSSHPAKNEEEKRGVWRARTA